MDKKRKNSRYWININQSARNKPSLANNHRQSTHIMLRPGAIFRECWLRLWERLAQRAASGEIEAVAPFLPHGLRHTAGSHLSMAGVDIRIIADILGHSTLKMAMRYTHQHMEYRRQVLNRISYLGITGKDQE